MYYTYCYNINTAIHVEDKLGRRRFRVYLHDCSDNVPIGTYIKIITINIITLCHCSVRVYATREAY